jgi:succinate dehydrogenase/fumarate reductase flavoprotein subunit
MAMSEIGLCSGHSASGVWVNERGETTLPGLYAAGDMASVPHNYMLGAFTYGKICAGSACEYIAGTDSPQIDYEAVEDEKKRVFRPLDHPAGIQPHLLEYKLRRHVNDYLQPPKSANRLERGLAYFERARAEIEQLGATGERRVRAQDAGRA